MMNRFSIDRQLVKGWVKRLAIAVFVMFSVVGAASAESSVRPPSNAVTVAPMEPTEGNVPGGVLGNTSDPVIWHDLRKGAPGKVTIPDPYAGTFIQSEGEDWRNIRNVDLSKVRQDQNTVGVSQPTETVAWITLIVNWVMIHASRILLGVLAVLAVFFAIRGRIKIKGGRSGRVMPRFSLVERIVHWFVAILFVLLALSGLILLFGRAALIPYIGSGPFGLIASAAMQGHNLFGPLFIPAILVLFVVFLRNNFFRLIDLAWIFKGGGLLGGHASSGRYNFGEKSWFWWATLCGIVLCASGMAMLFPDRAVALVQHVYPDVPGGRFVMQWANLAHSIMAVGFIAFAIGHIYLGTIGMEGALEGMTRGVVDENWAKEHHDIWYEEHLATVGTDEVKAEIEAAAGHV
jgi:formate dehydrogenase subunit gamma